MPSIVEEYRDYVSSVAKQHDVTPMDQQLYTLMHGAVGSSKEAGEALDIVYKHWMYKKALDKESLVEEIGDQLFYIQLTLIGLGVPLEVAMQKNMEKLKKRYPDGYSDAAAIMRRDKENTKEIKTS